jgi:hypothetical protein
VQYSTAPPSNFASLDSLELDRLHAHLRCSPVFMTTSFSLHTGGGATQVAVTCAVCRPIAHLALLWMGCWVDSGVAPVAR